MTKKKRRREPFTVVVRQSDTAGVVDIEKWASQYIDVVLAQYRSDL